MTISLLLRVSSGIFFQISPIVYTFSGILNKKFKNGELFYEVKWENYEVSTWEPTVNIPDFLINYYERTGNTKIPAARIKNTKVVGMDEKLWKNSKFKLTN